MHFIKLKIVGDRTQATQWMADHKAWLQRGFDDGIFLASGNLQGQAGGGIIANGLDASTLQQRLNDDPFVAHGIVEVEIAELAVSKADARLGFMMDASA